MYPDPQGCVPLLTRNHTVKSTLTLTDNNATLPCSAGEVTIDSRRDVRRSIRATLVDTDGALQSVITPYGVEAVVQQTLTWEDGKSWTVPLGVFVLSQPNYEQDSNGVLVSVEGDDRSRRVARAGRFNPVSLPKTTLLTEAIDALINPVYPTLTTQSTDGTNPAIGTLQNFLEGLDKDSWADAVTLADGFGYDLYFDVTGAPMISPYPDRDRVSLPDAFYLPGPIERANRAGGDENTYSGVVVTGWSATGTPVRAELWDTDPNSPTYVYGPFGFVPKWVEIQTPTTYDAALAAARGIFAQIGGASQSLQWTQIPNPGHDVWDVIAVSLPDLGVSLTSVLVDSVTIPLGLGVSTLRTRDGRWLQ